MIAPMRDVVGLLAAFPDGPINEAREAAPDFHGETA